MVMTPIRGREVSLMGTQKKIATSLVGRLGLVIILVVLVMLAMLSRNIYVRLRGPDFIRWNERWVNYQ